MTQAIWHWVVFGSEVITMLSCCGQEEMLNALVVAGPSVAAAMCALDHHQLQELGVDPGLISVSEPRPPYCLRIQLQKVCGSALSHSLLCKCCSTFLCFLCKE